jgi:hypothetical protein
MWHFHPECEFMVFFTEGYQFGDALDILPVKPNRACCFMRRYYHELFHRCCQFLLLRENISAIGF